MINTVGSFSLIWLTLWCALTVIFRMVYPLVRPKLFRLHPRHGVDLLLTWWAAPMVLSLLASLMLFAPVFENSLISPHCHENCIQHAPVTEQWALAAFGVLLAIVVIGSLLIHFFRNLAKGADMQRQLSALSVSQRGYRVLPSEVPLVFTLGWWRPKVFVSKGLLEGCTAKQLAIILDHESAHESRRDNLRLLLGRVFVLLIPKRWRLLVSSDLQVLCEQACDFEAAEKHDAVSVAETLVHVGRLLRSSVNPISSLAFDGGDLALRVKALLAQNSRYRLQPWQLLMIILVLCSALMLALDPLHHSAEQLIAWVDSTGTNFYPSDR
ncbi:MAG: M48 family metalloprotease [Pseudohongiella sp.]|nr:M48 family metalloprotease [Pseudohongiella sp.]